MKNSASIFYILTGGLLGLLTLVGCTMASDTSYSLDGTITGDIPEYIYLHKNKTIDSAKVTNGAFSFRGTVDKPTAVYFHIKNHSSMIDDWYYLDQNDIRIEISNTKRSIGNIELNFIKVDTIIGSDTELVRRHFENFSRTNKNSPEWNTILFSKLDSIISTQPKSDLSYQLLVKHISDKSLQRHQTQALFEKLDSVAFTVRQLEKLYQLIDPERALTKGNSIYDFSLPNPNEELLSTSSFRGKALLIDFWASWCRPCRVQMPELIEVYNEHQKANFEILGVSFDTQTNSWKRAIVKDSIPWKNTIDTLAFEGNISARYNVYELPSNLLIDQNGKIIEKNISIANLRKHLESRSDLSMSN